MSINDLTSAVKLSPISHKEGYKWRPHNPAEAATEQTNCLLSHRSDQNGKSINALLVIQMVCCT
jgi:hypothetical protein